MECSTACLTDEIDGCGPPEEAVSDTEGVLSGEACKSACAGVAWVRQWRSGEMSVVC